MIDVSLSFSVTVERILSTVDCSWSSWHSISNSTAPIFIFTRIGGFFSGSVNLSPLSRSFVVYCIAHLVHAQHLNMPSIAYWLLVNLGD